MNPNIVCKRFKPWNIWKENTTQIIMNRNFISWIQQIRRGSLKNHNQRGLVANDNRHHYKTIEKHTLEILCLKAPDTWPFPCTAGFLNE